MTIQELYVTTEGFKELRSHILAFLEKRALEYVFSNYEDARGMADAKKVIDEAFADLDDKFAPEKKQRVRAFSAR